MQTQTPTQTRLPKFRRAPALLANRQITERSLDIIKLLASYRFLPSSLIARLVPGNERITYAHLQTLYHKGFINRFTFPKLGNPGEFYYYIDNANTLKLLAEATHMSPEELPWQEVRSNKEKGYSDVHDPSRVEDMQGRLLFLKHEVAISRFHAMLEMACTVSKGRVELYQWKQGPDLWHPLEVPKLAYDAQKDVWWEPGGFERLPHRPDAFFSLRFPQAPQGQQQANFFYEADRKHTVTKRFNKKLRAHFHFIVKQKLHQVKYGIKRIRAVLIETVDNSWGETLRHAAKDPIVSGSPTPLFWFTTSQVLSKPQEIEENNRIRKVPLYLLQPEIILKKIWASPFDDTLYSLLD